MAKITVQNTPNTVLNIEEQRLIGWSAKRELSKINSRIHTDAIKQNLILAKSTKSQASIIYAKEMSKHMFH